MTAVFSEAPLHAEEKIKTIVNHRRKKCWGVVTPVERKLGEVVRFFIGVKQAPCLDVSYSGSVD